jgi:hypothetical protein
VPVHVATVKLSVVDRVGVRVSEHSAGLAPVAEDVAVITPVATVRPDMYWVAVVEQPAAVSSAGMTAFVDKDSDTDVLHAAIAASVSDIFERIT